MSHWTQHITLVRQDSSRFGEPFPLDPRARSSAILQWEYLAVFVDMESALKEYDPFQKCAHSSDSSYESLMLQYEAAETLKQIRLFA
jgi:hypothetical protein